MNFNLPVLLKLYVFMMDVQNRYKQNVGHPGTFWPIVFLKVHCGDFSQRLNRISLVELELQKSRNIEQKKYK